MRSKTGAKAFWNYSYVINQLPLKEATYHFFTVTDRLLQVIDIRIARLQFKIVAFFDSLVIQSVRLRSLSYNMLIYNDNALILSMRHCF